MQHPASPAVARPSCQTLNFMDKPKRIFTITREDDQFLLGRMDDSELSGAFLQPEYLSRLDEVLSAAKVRIGPAAPDAVKNLFGILERLLDIHRSQTGSEFKLSDSAEFKKVAEELQKAIDDLNGGDDGPKRA